MNTAVRVLTQGNVISKAENYSLVLPLPKRNVLLLLSAILISALALIYIKDLNRCLFIDYQDAQKIAQKLEVEHGKFLLEESAWANSARIQKISEERLHMKAPLPDQMPLIEIF